MQREDAVTLHPQYLFFQSAQMTSEALAFFDHQMLPNAKGELVVISYKNTLTKSDLRILTEKDLIDLFPKFKILANNLLVMENDDFDVRTVANAICVGNYLDCLLQKDPKAIVRILKQSCSFDKWPIPREGQSVFVQVVNGTFPMLLLDFLTTNIYVSDVACTKLSALDKSRNNVVEFIPDLLNCDALAWQYKSVHYSDQVREYRARGQTHSAHFWGKFYKMSLQTYFENLAMAELMHRVPLCLFCNPSVNQCTSLFSTHEQDKTQQKMRKAYSFQCTARVMCSCDACGEVGSILCHQCLTIFQEPLKTFVDKPSTCPQIKIKDSSAVFGTRNIFIPAVNQDALENRLTFKGRIGEKLWVCSQPLQVPTYVKLCSFKFVKTGKIMHAAGTKIVDEKEVEIPLCKKKMCKHNDVSCPWFEKIAAGKSVCGCFSVANGAKRVFNCSACTQCFAICDETSGKTTQYIFGGILFFLVEMLGDVSVLPYLSNFRFPLPEDTLIHRSWCEVFKMARESQNASCFAWKSTQESLIDVLRINKPKLQMKLPDLLLQFSGMIVKSSFYTCSKCSTAARLLVDASIMNRTALNHTHTTYHADCSLCFEIWSRTRGAAKCPPRAAFIAPRVPASSPPSVGSLLNPCFATPSPTSLGPIGAKIDGYNSHTCVQSTVQNASNEFLSVHDFEFGYADNDGRRRCTLFCTHRNLPSQLFTCGHMAPRDQRPFVQQCVEVQRKNVRKMEVQESISLCSLSPSHLETFVVVSRQILPPIYGDIFERMFGTPPRSAEEIYEECDVYAHRIPHVQNFSQFVDCLCAQMNRVKRVLTHEWAKDVFVAHRRLRKVIKVVEHDTIELKHEIKRVSSSNYPFGVHRPRTGDRKTMQAMTPYFSRNIVHNNFAEQEESWNAATNRCNMSSSFGLPVCTRKNTHHPFCHHQPYEKFLSKSTVEIAKTVLSFVGFGVFKETIPFIQHFNRFCGQGDKTLDFLDSIAEGHHVLLDLAHSAYINFAKSRLRFEISKENVLNFPRKLHETLLEQLESKTDVFFETSPKKPIFYCDDHCTMGLRVMADMRDFVFYDHPLSDFLTKNDLSILKIARRGSRESANIWILKGSSSVKSKPKDDEFEDVSTFQLQFSDRVSQQVFFLERHYNHLATYGTTVASYSDEKFKAARKLFTLILHPDKGFILDALHPKDDDKVHVPGLKNVEIFKQSVTNFYHKHRTKNHFLRIKALDLIPGDA